MTKMHSHLLSELANSDRSPAYYQYYPRLFKDYFDEVSDDKIVKLSEAGFLYYHSTLQLDSVVDEGDISVIPVISILQEETIKILTSIYGAESNFWNYWNLRREEYYQAVKLEKSLKNDAKTALSTYELLADKKSAFGKVAIDCLHLLTHLKNEVSYSRLLKSHSLFSVGFQLYDDVKDFSEDMNKGQFNWAISQLSECIDFNSYNNDIPTLNKLLFIRGVGQNILNQSIDYFQKALEVIDTTNTESEWKDVLNDTKKTIEGYLDVTNGYIKTIEKRIYLQNNGHGINRFIDYRSIKSDTIRKGLEHIHSDYQRDFAELKHIMYLSKLEGFENSEQIHVSDIFQRALVADCLIDVSNKYNLTISEYLNSEIDYLINNRNRDKIGGWSYFPTVNEIASDIDDLGQIIQLFINANMSHLIDKYCGNAVEVALSERACSNGGIETWIIPKSGKSEIQLRQESFNETKWGKGPDLEVVANFVYALHLYNKSLLKDQIERGVEYIAKEQDESGFWNSRWYYGNFYGTYVSIRVLKLFENNYNNNIQTALEYLTDAQNLDGGYSMDNKGESDPLSTSLAILALKFITGNESDTIRNAERYLTETQNKNGCWNAIDFIKPKGSYPYGSITLTTAFVLKALCR